MKNDHQIQKDVMDELNWEPSLNTAKIAVTVNNGIVTLSGYVKYYSQKIAAEEAAQRVKGVRAVAEDIEIFMADCQLTDFQIAENVLKALEWNTLIPEEKLRIKVDDGRVTVDGEVTWLYQKEAALKLIQCLNGVKGVIDLIFVNPTLDTFIIKENIRKALERNAELEFERIKIDTVGSKVIIRGTVRSWNERKAIKRAVASAPGVTEVDDQVTVIY